MTLAPGTTLGPYAIVSQLGSGGMGVVYLAHDPRLDRHVAIKLLPPDLTRDETAKQRFLQEAKAASALSRRHKWGRLKAKVHRLYSRAAWRSLFANVPHAYPAPRWAGRVLGMGQWR